MSRINGHKVNRGYPEIGQIPEGWNHEAIGNKIDLLSGFAFSSEKYSTKGIRLLRGANIKRGQIDWSEDITQYWSDDIKLYSRYMLEEGDLVIAMDGSLVGRSYAVITKRDLPALLLQRVARIRSKEIDLNFLKAYIGSYHFINYCDSVKTVTAIPHISARDIKHYKIPLPTLLEQRKIADILNTWDTCTFKLVQLIQLRQQRKKALMQLLLTGKKRLPGFGGKWKEVKLDDIFERVTRRNEEGNTNVVTISAQRGFVRQEDFFNKIVASEVLDNYFLVHKGEFCYNKSYSNGYPWGATKRLKDFDKAVVTTLYICFGLKDHNNHSAEFFEHYFEAGSLDKGLTKIAHEGGRAHGLLNVTPSDFFSLKITVPEFEERAAIAAVLQVADKEIQLLQQKLEGMKEEKKGLMQKLLTGQVRVKL